MFWKKSHDGQVKLPGPKDIPELVGRHMVVDMKKDPDWVWQLKAVIREVGKKEYYCRVFDNAAANKANVQVKNWTSLDNHPELILWEGDFNEKTHEARPEKVPAAPAP